MRLTVIGTGYVGLNTGVAAAYIGHDVVCVDKDPVKLELLTQGKSPIHEQGLDELLARVRDRMRFTADTPTRWTPTSSSSPWARLPKENGEADTRYVETRCAEWPKGWFPPHVHHRGQVHRAHRHQPPGGPRGDPAWPAAASTRYSFRVQPRGFA